MEAGDPKLTPPTPDEQREIDAIIAHFGKNDDRQSIYRLVDGQLNVLHARATSLIQLASVVITVTGFSGRIIADTNDLAQGLIIAGVTLVLVAAVVSLLFVLPIRWISSLLHLSTQEWILYYLRRRRRKSVAIRMSTAILVLGMSLYIASIAIMLLYPEAAELQKVR